MKTSYIAQMKRGDKRAVSPLIATVLLIVISISAFGLIFTWMKNVIQEPVEKFGEPIENLCQKLDFTATLSDDRGEIFIDNRGNVPLYAVNLFVYDSGRSTVKFLRSRDGVVTVGESDSIKVRDVDLAKANIKVDVVPVVLGKGRNTGEGKLYPCENNKVAVLS